MRTISFLSLSLLALSATTHPIASIATVTSHDNNAKNQATISTGLISTVAGFRTLIGGSNADGIAATSATFEFPAGLVLDKEGSLYIAVAGENRIRKVAASTGIITTVAGQYYVAGGYDGEGYQATSTRLHSPAGLSLDSYGNIFIADTGNGRIRKVAVSTGVMSTVAGNGDMYSAFEDNIAATNTSLSSPNDVAVDASGNIFIADTHNRRVRKVTASTGMITTIAGTGLEGKDVPILPNTAATAFSLERPYSVTVDISGNVYIAGYYDACIFKVTASTGYISIVAGTGPGTFDKSGYNGDDIQATAAKLYNPVQVFLDTSGNIFISDLENHRVRKVTASTGIITTVAGTGKIAYTTQPDDGEGGSATSAQISAPYGIAVDDVGNVYFSDHRLHDVRKVTYTETTPSSSVTSAPSVTRPPSSSAAPSSSVASKPTVPSSSSRAPVASPSAFPSSISMTSTAPAAPSSTGSQSSATTHTHIAQELHVTMILLSLLLILHLCRDA